MTNLKIIIYLKENGIIDVVFLFKLEQIYWLSPDIVDNFSKLITDRLSEFTFLRDNLVYSPKDLVYTFRNFVNNLDHMGTGVKSATDIRFRIHDILKPYWNNLQQLISKKRLETRSGKIEAIVDIIETPDLKDYYINGGTTVDSDIIRTVSIDLNKDTDLKFIKLITDRMLNLHLLSAFLEYYRNSNNPMLIFPTKLKESLVTKLINLTSIHEKLNDSES